MPVNMVKQLADKFCGASADAIVIISKPLFTHFQGMRQWYFVVSGKSDTAWTNSVWIDGNKKRAQEIRLDLINEMMERGITLVHVGDEAQVVEIREVLWRNYSIRDAVAPDSVTLQ